MPGQEPKGLRCPVTVLTAEGYERMVDASIDSGSDLDLVSPELAQGFLMVILCGPI